MGQAKKRGDFETRKQLAVDREAALALKRQLAKHERRMRNQELNGLPSRGREKRVLIEGVGRASKSLLPYMLAGLASAPNQ